MKPFVNLIPDSGEAPLEPEAITELLRQLLELVLAQLRANHAPAIAVVLLASGQQRCFGGNVPAELCKSVLLEMAESLPERENAPGTVSGQWDFAPKQ